MSDDDTAPCLIWSSFHVFASGLALCAALLFSNGLEPSCAESFPRFASSHFNNLSDFTSSLEGASVSKDISRTPPFSGLEPWMLSLFSTPGIISCAVCIPAWRGPPVSCLFAKTKTPGLKPGFLPRTQRVAPIVQQDLSRSSLGHHNLFLDGFALGELLHELLMFNTSLLFWTTYLAG